MVTKPTEKVWWICSSVQAGPSGPASALSKTQARVRVRAAALPLETIWSSCCRSSAARVMTYFWFMAEVPVRKDRFPPLYGSLPTFQYNLDKALVVVLALLDLRAHPRTHLLAARLELLHTQGAVAVGVPLL